MSNQFQQEEQIVVILCDFVNLKTVIKLPTVNKFSTLISNIWRQKKTNALGIQFKGTHILAVKVIPKIYN